MSSSGQRTHLKLLTVGDFDPQTDQPIEYDFIGRKIAGRYTVRAHIGGGGMADVFQATDEELGVDVAIKLLKLRRAARPHGPGGPDRRAGPPRQPREGVRH